MSKIQSGGCQPSDDLAWNDPYNTSGTNDFCNLLISFLTHMAFLIKESSILYLELLPMMLCVQIVLTILKPDIQLGNVKHFLYNKAQVLYCF